MIKISFIVPAENLVDMVYATYPEHARVYAQSNGDDTEYSFAVYVARNYRSIPRKALDSDIIIARGLITAELKRIHPNLALVEVPIGSEMVATTLRAVHDHPGSPIAVIGSRNMNFAAQGIGEALNIDIKIYPQESNEDFVIKRDIDAILADGRKVIICGPVTYNFAKGRDCHPYLLGMSTESIWQALTGAKHGAVPRRQEREKAVQFQAVLNSAHEGIIATDTSGNITVFNANAAEILQINATKAIGANVYDILPMGKLTDNFRTVDYADRIIPYRGEHLSVNKTGVILAGELSGHVIALQRSSAIQKAESKMRQQLYAKGHVARYRFPDIIGESPAVQEAIASAKDFAAVTSNILIIGDTGTGKEVFAQSIHNQSARRDNPFVAINCAALSKALLESELFGYVEGAFTGAARGGKPGIFETAHTGTIFLDEISEIPLDLQGRLLRVLQERQIMRLGDDKIIPIDVRIISATNKHLTAEVMAKKFRRDLYYRLNVLTLSLPSLNERDSDILRLAAHFIDEYCQMFDKKPIALSDGACQVLMQKRWDGNIRELRNTCECLVVLNKTGTIAESDLERIFDNSTFQPRRNRSRASASSEEFTRFHHERLVRALADNQGDRAGAAEQLGISKTTLWRRMKKFNVEL